MQKRDAQAKIVQMVLKSEQDQAAPLRSPEASVRA